MSNEVRAFIGKGQVYLRRLDQAFGLLPIGECSALELSIETDEKTLPSNTQSGGGVAATANSVTSLGLSMTVHSFNDRNVAMALNGDVSAVAAGAVTDEPHKAYPGGIVPLNKIPDTSQTITVTSNPAGTSYAEGADFTVTAAGIRITAGGAINAETDILVSYTGKAHSVIEMLTNSGYEYELFFEGLNDADNGLPFLIDIYRSKFKPTTGLGFITDDFAELGLEGSALIDTSKSGVGVSKYASIKRV